MANDFEATFVWTRDSELWKEAAAFFARVISLNPAYISHSELQMGLSLDGVNWVNDVEERFLAEISESDDARDVIIVRSDKGAIIGAANVTWTNEEGEVSFAIIQDMAVEPEFRSHGLGERMCAAIEEEALRRRVNWIFLESGKNNGRAHHFFERQGFSEISHVFAKKL